MNKLDQAAKRVAQVSADLLAEFRPDQMDRLAAGYALVLEAIPETQRSAILDKAILALAASHRTARARVPAAVLRGIEVVPRISIVIDMPTPDGGSREITIDLAALFPALEGSSMYVAALPGDWRSNDSILVPRHLWLPSATDATYRRSSPPAAAPITAVDAKPGPSSSCDAGGASHIASRIALARDWAMSLARPIGIRYLYITGTPFQYEDFVHQRTFSVGSLNSEESLWMEGIVRQYSQMISEQQDLLKRYPPKRDRLAIDKDGTVNITERFVIALREEPDGAPRVIFAGPHTPLDPVPSWADLSSARFALRIAYRFVLTAFERVLEDEKVRIMLAQPLRRSGPSLPWVSEEHPRTFAPGTAPPVYVISDAVEWILE